MTRKVMWSKDALKDFQGILEYIATDNVQNARLVADRVDKSIHLLSETPFGRPGRMIGTYEAVVPKTPFIIAYLLEGSHALAIIRVIHGARDWRQGEWPK